MGLPANKKVAVVVTALFMAIPGSIILLLLLGIITFVFPDTFKNCKLLKKRRNRRV